jgi:hypothetical protein
MDRRCANTLPGSALALAAIRAALVAALTGMMACSGIQSDSKPSVHFAREARRIDSVLVDSKEDSNLHRAFDGRLKAAMIIAIDATIASHPNQSPNLV